MKEYIEREQAIALFYPVDPENDGSDGCTVVYKSENFSSSEIEAMLSNLPAADVAEVVRCKDCIYHSGALPGQPNIICFQMKDNDFCSYGARMDKEDAEEGRG